MNPEAPDPPPEAAAGGSGPSKEQEKEPGAGGGAPDYAALLQYLQFYQKQMEDNKK